MKRVLLAAFKQETSTFNPQPSGYDLFRVYEGPQVLDALQGTRTEVAGGIDVFAETGGIEVLPAYSAMAVSGGPVIQDDLDRVTAELLAAARRQGPVDGAYIVLHGAMAGQREGDPEGHLIGKIREIIGDVPLVASLDLHGVLSQRLFDQTDVLVPFHTYPHTDQYETGRRAAAQLVRLLNGEHKPAKVRIEMPMLVRGDELLTATGLFGQAIRSCQDIEADAEGWAAGVLIGNPFTDVPDLQSNVIAYGAGDSWTQQKALEIARFMWGHRQRLVAPLKSIPEAIRIARGTDGLTVFSDAADATSSGAPGDSNAILKGLLEHGYAGKALLPLVDAAAVALAFEKGVGSFNKMDLGASLDTGRHAPLNTAGYVKALSDGHFTYEDGTEEKAGPTAVIQLNTPPADITLCVTSKPVNIMGRRVFTCFGLDPRDFDLVVCKSPNGFRTHYEEIAAAIVPVDAPGATSANLRSLPFERCVRPIFPLDENAAPPFSLDD